MISRADWTDEKHRVGRRLPRPAGSLGPIVSLTPEGNLELGAIVEGSESDESSWSRRETRVGYDFCLWGHIGRLVEWEAAARERLGVGTSLT